MIFFICIATFPEHIWKGRHYYIHVCGYGRADTTYNMHLGRADMIYNIHVGRADMTYNMIQIYY